MIAVATVFGALCASNETFVCCSTCRRTSYSSVQMRTHTALPCDRKPFFPLALCSCVAQSMIETEVLPCSYCVEVPAVSCIQVSFYCLLRNPHFDTYLLSQSATCNHKRLRSDHSGCCTSYPRIFRILSLSLSLSHTHTHTQHTHTHTHTCTYTHTLNISHRSGNPCAASFLSVTLCSFQGP